MSDVRGGPGSPTVAGFAGLTSPTPSTPLYVDTSTGDLYVLIAEVPTKVGSIAADSNLILTQQSFERHQVSQTGNEDASLVLSQRTFAQLNTLPGVLGAASPIIEQQVFRRGSLPATWGA